MPRTRITSSMRSTSRATSGRCVGTMHVACAVGLASRTIVAAEALEDRRSRLVERHVDAEERGRCARARSATLRRAPTRSRARRAASFDARRRPRAAASAAPRARGPRGVSPGSTPRSKRWLDSVCSPCRRARATDAARIEVRALEEDALRVRLDLARRAAHHAGERDRALAVADDEIVGDELARRRRRASSSSSPSFARRTTILLAAHAVEIERVHRVAVLEHHEVRDVDDVRDRADAERAGAGSAARAATGRS